jgi:hypothetical protein
MQDGQRFELVEHRKGETAVEVGVDPDGEAGRAQLRGRFQHERFDQIGEIHHRGERKSPDAVGVVAQWAAPAVPASGYRIPAQTDYQHDASSLAIGRLTIRLQIADHILSPA